MDEELDSIIDFLNDKDMQKALSPANNDGNQPSYP